MKYSVICCDPPYKFGDKLTMSKTKRGAAANYSTLTNDELCSLPIKDISDPNGTVLALWCPSSLLAEGMKIMTAWGFQLKQTHIWCKINSDNKLLDLIRGYAPKAGSKVSQVFGDFALAFGLGRLFRQSHEICLIGINNTKIYKQLENHSQRSVSFAPNLRHSAKPEHLQNSLDKMFPNAKKIELFARRERPDWLCLGNEVGDKEDIRVSLQKLIDSDISILDGNTHNAAAQ